MEPSPTKKAVTDEKIDVDVTSPSFETLIGTCVSYISRGVELNQTRLIQRAIRQTTLVRQMSSKAGLVTVVMKYFPTSSPSYTLATDGVDKLPDAAASVGDGSSMDVEGSVGATGESLVHPQEILPEVEIYLLNLLLATLLKSESTYPDAAYMSTLVVHRLRQFNRRSLDHLAAKVFANYSLAFERIDRLEQIRSTLMACYQTSCYHKDEMCQIVLLNCLVRNYFHYDLVEQAQALTEKTQANRSDTTSTVSHNQYCRHMYYTGRAHAIQLEYSKAYVLLQMALRKAPQDYALGFMKAVTKLMVLVQLLMGGIPERMLFNGGGHTRVRDALKPYLYLTQAVRAGDLQQFTAVADHEVYKPIFVRDKNYALIRRLGHNVLKTGLKKISVSYSRISLHDIAAKLHLPSVRATEFVCAKAIRDGVIEAKIDHEQGWLVSEELQDIYSSEEPQKAFHKRIVFCLELHNDAVKAMRYPPSDDAFYKKQLAVEEAEEKLRKDKDGEGGSKSKNSNDEKTIDEIIRDMEEDDDMDMD